MKIKSNYYIIIGIASNLWVFVLFSSCNSFDIKTDASEITSDFKVEKKTVTDTIQLNQLIEEAENLIKENKFREAINVLKKIVTDYEDYLLENNPKYLVKTYLDLSYNYSSIHNQKYELVYTKKAIEICEKKGLITTQDYLTAYNNLYVYQRNYGDLKSSNETISDFEKYIDKLNKGKVILSKEDENYAKRIFYRMEISRMDVHTQQELIEKKLGDFYKFVIKSGNEREENLNFYLSTYDEFCYRLYETEQYYLADKHLKIFNEKALAYDFPFYSMKANAILGAVYYALKKYEEGCKKIDIALSTIEFDRFSSSKYSLETIKAMNLVGLRKFSEATDLVEQNIIDLVENHTHKKTEIADLNFNSFRDLNSHNYINIFATSALIFKDSYTHSKNVDDLNKTEKLSLIAAEMFNEFYLNGSYNPTLNKLQDKISEGLLFVITEKYQQNEPKKIELLNWIERNASQHLYKEVQRKFLLANKSLSKIYDEFVELEDQKKYLEGIKKQGDQANNELNAISKRCKELKALIQKNFPNFSQVDTDFDITSIKNKINKIADANLIKYYVAFENVYVILINANSIEVKKIDKKDKISQELELLIKEYKKPDIGYNNQNKAISSQLVPFNIAGKITIIPDKFLNYLPFESLIVNNKLWIESAQITYAYSFPLWLLSNEKKNNSEFKLVSFAPQYNPGKFQSNSVFNLPFAKEESEKICEITNGSLFSDNQATKANFINSFRNYSIYHLAMHSYLYADDFEKSCLLFANNEPLYFYELYEYFLPADLVVLSACNSGNGTLIKGEGIMSLSRAFTYSGVKSTVVSLWQVPDKETSELMILFYKNLEKGMEKDKALQLAKLEFLKQNPLKTHPYYWSGFILNGNNSALKTKSYYWYYIVGFGLFTLLILFRKKLIQLRQ
jgi:CHAT domain-containing protein